MDFQSALIFVASIIIIIASGVILGMAVRGRGTSSRFVDEVQLQTYQELVEAMDGLRMADREHKQQFIQAYYRAIMFAPDRVVQSLNAFLQSATKSEEDYDPSAQTAARDLVVAAMRQDVQAGLDRKTNLKPTDLYSIEVSDSQVGAPRPSADSVSQEISETA